jgi:protocatechuate 3,4-dioxygenase beta subunit
MKTLKESFNSDRRNLLKNAGMAGFGLIGSGILMTTIAKAAASTRTPAQTEGPFYPITNQLDKDADMTVVQGHNQTALGAIVQLNGTVYDADTGLPVTGALIEFWQACASGKYNHPQDPNQAPLDPNFQYWAQVHTDSQGRYGLKTIKPGAYQADSDWIRPPHIHVKVHKVGYPSLTTQIYFKNDEYNDSDKILQKLTLAQQNLVVVDFSDMDDRLTGSWNIFIGKFSASRDIPKILTPTPEID